MKSLPRSVLLLLVSALCAFGAAAQTYPNRPVKLIVADSAGGAPDQLARLVAQKLSDGLGQQVVVDNRAGAGGIVGAEMAAKAAPDGYTLLLTTTAIYAILPNLRKDLPYDPIKDFIPISRIATASNVLVVNNALPAKNIAELVKLAKEKPGALNYASAGVGTPAHLAGEMLNLLADIKVVHVPYKGAAPALTDVIAGNAQYIITFTDRRGCAHDGWPRTRAGDYRCRAQSEPPRLADHSRDSARLRDHADVGHRGADWHAVGSREQTQCRDRQGHGPAGHQGKGDGDGRDAGRRLAGSVRSLHGKGAAAAGRSHRQAQYRSYRLTPRFSTSSDPKPFREEPGVARLVQNPPPTDE